MTLRFLYFRERNHSHHTVAGFTLVELLVIIAILAILTVVGFLLLGNTTATARDSQRIANIRQLHDATRLQAASLHVLPIPYQSIPISIGGGSGTIDLTASGANSQYSVFVDGNTKLSTLSGSRLIALTKSDGVDTLLAGGTLSGTLSNQNLGWQGYADASIAGNLNYSDTVDPQDQALFTYRLGQNRDKSQFLAYLENPEHENQTPLLWRNISDEANAASPDYTKRYPYVWGDRLGIVLDKGTNAPVQQGLTPPVNNNTGSTGSGNTIDTSGMMVGVGQGHSCVLKADQSVVCWGDNYDGQTDVPSGLVDVVQISVGYYHSCALQSDGVVACWGDDNGYGYVGGILNFSSVPGYSEGLHLAISGPSDVIQISAGRYHTCALKSNGAVQCVGSDWDGQSTLPPGLSDVIQISAGGYHTCALKSDGSVECWGDNWAGQTDIPLGLSNVTQISAGGSHTCALKSDGTVECWGHNGAGQSTPPTGLIHVTQVSSDSSYTCALKSDGSVECWGGYDPCHDGCYAPYPTSFVAGLHNIVQISVGYEYACALKSDGGVVCWNNDGSVSEVPEELQNFPVILNSVVFDDHRLTTGNNFTCAITSTGGVECWGSNDVGQLDIPVGLDSVIEVNAGYGFACALKSDGTLSCWGYPSGGQTDVPVGLSGVVQMSVGYNNVCALKSDGTVVCWGDNSDGQTDVPNELNHIVQIATGWNFACALKDTGRMVCWGYNTAPGGGEISSEPLFPPSDIGTVKQISAGDEHMCAIKTDDSVVCWGSNGDLSGASDVAHVSAGEYYSCLAHTDGSVECGGNNGNGQTDTPMTLSGVTEISTSMGGSHTCALKSDNTIECWGQGMDGQTEVPPEFGGIASSPITEPVFEDQGMTTGYQFTCALKSDATVECWGLNADGQTTVPSGLTNVTQISAGASHTCALKSDGTVECWGLNDDGQTTTPSGLSNVTQISAGASHVCALKSDGTVECWGLNDNGQTTPPSGLTDVVQVVSGDYHSCALRSDRTLTCWGSDSEGQTDVPTLTRVAQLAAGSAYTCALRETGRVFCWGTISGDIGVDNVVKISAGGGNLCTMKADGSVECFTQSTFIHGENMIPSSLSAIDIATSPTHVCARDASNQVICWGSNWEGESDSPVPFGSGFTPLNLASTRYEDQRISAGHAFSCAIKTDETVECWGNNYLGLATPPSGLNDVIQITSGQTHTCALKSDGTIECWGFNYSGENDVPIGLTNVVQISAGDGHTCALKSDNTVECWGSNNYSESSIPDGLNHDIIEVVAGNYTTCVLQTNGKMQCIGGNSLGFRNEVDTIGSTMLGIEICSVQYDTSVMCNSVTPPSPITNAVKVANSNTDACALKSDGTVECWGDNSNGQGNIPSGLSNVIDITVGSYHVCVLKSDNSVVCWGNNDNGQTDIPAALEPVIVPNVIYEDTNLSAGKSHTCTIESGTTMCTGYMDHMENNTAQVSAGGTDTCVLKTDGTVACYGITINYSNLDGYEQLDVPAGLNNVIQISSGQGYNCALKSDGTVECWGKYGHITPTVPSLTDVVSISVAESGYHACALKSDGTVECWGDTYNNALTIPSGLNAVKQISAGYGYTCALKSNGKVTCWGSNTNGRSTVPVGLSNVVQISSGGSHSCALKSDGTVECWGNNTSGQRTVPSGLSGVVDITTGGSHSCALKSDDNIVCWGSNVHSQRDINNLVSLPNSISNSVSPIFEEKNISTMHGNSYSSGNFFYACAINSNSNVQCWFDYENTGYQEAYVPPGLTNVIQVIVLDTQSCALKSDGTVECWRFRPEYTTLALGPAFPLGSVIQISGAGNSICALRSDGTLVCWGDNFYGQNTLPIGIGPVKQISHGGGSICALKSDTTVACWGVNDYGQNNIPSGLTGVVQISHNGTSVCALKSDTTVVCWGTGTRYGWSGLEPPIGLSDVVQINQSCALQSSGMVVCWNKTNSFEGYYINTPRDYTKKGFTDVIEISGSGICGFKSNQTISCWDDSDSNYLNVPSSFSPESIISPILNENYLSVGGLGDICYIKSDTHVECGQWSKLLISGAIENHPTNAGSPPGPGIYEETFLEPGQDFWKECASDMTWCDLVQWKAAHNQPPANLDNVVQVVNNDGFVCALQSNGSVTCWHPGATGYPSGTIENIPPETSSGVTALFNGGDTCVLKTDASTLCIDYQSPGNYISNAPSVTNIVEMSGHCTLTSDGRVSCSNTQILDGIDHVKSIEAERNKYCAITGENRTLVCWLNGGFNTSFDRVEFAQDTPNSLGPITSVAIGYNHTCALKPNGTMECWGGDNTHGENDVPIGLSGVIDISTGGHVSCAMLSNQTVRCWGSILD